MMRVTAEPGDQVPGVTFHRSKAAIDDAIEKAIEQLANRPGAHAVAGSVVADSPGDRITRAAANAVKLLVPDPADPTNYVHPLGGVVKNAASPLARYVARTFPKAYRYLDQPADVLAKRGKAENYRFSVVPEDPSRRAMGMPELKERGAFGVTVPRSAGREVDVYLEEATWRLLRNPKALQELRQTKPSQFREVVASLPHEIQHALYARLDDADKVGWGYAMPQKGSVYDRMKKYVTGLEKPNVPAEGRVGPRHLEAFMNHYLQRGQPAHVGVREAHIQRSAENMARSAGLITRKEIKDDLTREQVQEWVGPYETVQQTAQRIRDRVRQRLSQ
jgi:hypothetical protein